MTFDVKTNQSKVIADGSMPVSSTHNRFYFIFLFFFHQRNDLKLTFVLQGITESFSQDISPDQRFLLLGKDYQKVNPTD